MTRVLGVVGSEAETALAAERAVEFAREHGAELELLAVADRPAWLPLPRRLLERRDRAAFTQLERAMANAVAAGVDVSAAYLRRGQLLDEVVRHVENSGTHIVFFARLRPRWWARFLGRPVVELNEVTLSQRPRRNAAALGADVASPVARVAGAPRTRAAASAG
jgi:nucleotide-binding universal stress UspA family protein